MVFSNSCRYLMCSYTSGNGSEEVHSLSWEGSRRGRVRQWLQWKSYGCTKQTCADTGKTERLLKLPNQHIRKSIGSKGRVFHCGYFSSLILSSCVSIFHCWPIWLQCAFPVFHFPLLCFLFLELFFKLWISCLVCGNFIFPPLCNCSFLPLPF